MVSAFALPDSCSQANRVVPHQQRCGRGPEIIWSDVGQIEWGLSVGFPELEQFRLFLLNAICILQITVTLTFFPVVDSLVSPFSI